MEIKFTDFYVGETISFSKIFTQTDFNTFSKLSGDENLLHHDQEYALQSGFNEPIVPFHLLLAPLSKVAGMHLPGEPSLYLRHSLRAVNSLRYGEKIVYSAKIKQISYESQQLIISVLGICGSKIIFDGEMITKARDSEWEVSQSTPSTNTNNRRKVLITGASGEIARQTAKIFQQNGWSLVLQSRDVDQLSRDYSSNDVDQNVEIIKADLGQQSGLNKLVEFIKKDTHIEAILHTASPPIDAEVSELVSVNFVALRKIAQSVLPQMLRRQSGTIFHLSSAAIFNHSNELENYSAAKQMAGNVIQNIDAQYSTYGVQGRILAPTIVATEYSSMLRKVSREALLPLEVAEQIYAMVVDSKQVMRWQEFSSIMDGNFAFTPVKKPDVQRLSNASSKFEHDPEWETNISNKERLLNAITRVVKSVEHEKIILGGLGFTPGWDSLAQLEIILEVEREFKIKFSSHEFELLKDFQRILERINEEFDCKK